MSRLLLFIAVAVTALSSCSVYRSGETTKTPDDVYYSPARPGAAYVEVEKKQDNGYYRADDYTRSDDQWLRMRVRDRYRWSSFDDYDWNDWRYSSFSNSAFSYSPYYFNNYWNNYYNWNSYYNPYCPQIIILNPSKNAPVYSKVRTFALGGYTNTNYNNTNRPAGTKLSTRYSSPSYNNSNSSNRTNSNNSLGSSIRKVFSNGNSNSGSSYYTPSSSDRPVRSYTPSNSSSSSTQSYTPARSSSSSSSSGSSSSGSSSSGSSGGGAGSRPARGN